jgi:hypothetical protein
VVAEVRRLAERTPHLALPARHDVRAGDVVLRRLHGALAAAAERGPTDFADLLLTPGLGARTVLSLAMAAEVIHGAPCRFGDPARFSLAHGGKDGHPYPVPLRVYDETLRVLRRAVDRARLGEDDRLAAIRRLELEARRLEADARGPGLDAFAEGERAASAAYGGRSVTAAARGGATPTPGQIPTQTSSASPTRPPPIPAREATAGALPARDRARSDPARAPAQLALFRR